MVVFFSLHILVMLQGVIHGVEIYRFNTISFPDWRKYPEKKKAKQHIILAPEIIPSGIKKRKY